MPFWRALQDQGVERVCFAGAVSRPRLDPSLFDPATAQLVPRLLGAMQAGDDATLREVLALFEEAGFAIVAAHEIAADLLPGPGVLAGAVTPRDEADAVRAAQIVAALGTVGALGADFTSVADATLLTGGSIAAATNAEHIIYVADTGALYYNANAATAGGLTLIGTFTDKPVLVAGEFTIVA